MKDECQAKECTEPHTGNVDGEHFFCRDHMRMIINSYGLSAMIKELLGNE